MQGKIDAVIQNDSAGMLEGEEEREGDETAVTKEEVYGQEQVIFCVAITKRNFQGRATSMDR